MSFARVNGVNLYYELNGEHGNPMVLIHGSWVDHSHWNAVVSGFSRSFRVLAYDRRGHGRSEKVGTQGSWEEDAQDASDLITTLGLRPAHVVGNSGGAIIAMKLAILQPSALRSMVIHEPPLLDFPLDPAFANMLKDGKSRVESVVEVIQRGNHQAGARQFVETIAVGPGGWDKLPEEVRKTFAENASTFLDEMRDPNGLSVDLEALSRFRKTTLLSYGGKSAPFFRPIVEKLASLIPGSRLETYPNDGHTPHTSNPDEFVQRVTSFIQSN